MGYHSLLDTAAHTSQPGFAILSVNGTHTQISPVAQLLAHMAAAIRAAHAGVAALPNLAPDERTEASLTVLGKASLPCVQAAAACAGNGTATALILNRCDRSIALPHLASEVVKVCVRGREGRVGGGVSYSASYGTPTKTWAEMPRHAPPWDAPLKPAHTSGEGVDGHTFTFVHVG